MRIAYIAFGLKRKYVEPQLQCLNDLAAAEVSWNVAEVISRLRGWEYHMSNCRFLVLDDDPAVGSLLVDAIEIIGFQARAVSKYAAFNRSLDEWNPTHITLDLLMPDHDGIETIRSLAARRSTARIILISGVDRTVLEMAATIGRERGLDIAGTLTKPWRLDNLTTLITAVARNEDTFGQVALARAIERNELRLFLQPKVHLPLGRIYGFEALVRWQHPQRGLQAPDSFIQVAERNNLMDPITRWVLESSADALLDWQSEGLNASIAVNISAKNLLELSVADELADIVRSRGLKCSSFTLELTESSTITSLVDALDILVRLRLKNFGLSIDDFGTGFSSLAQLQRMPFTELKIDRSFVSASERCPEAVGTIRAAINIANQLQLNVVAEGIENATTERIMMGLGIECAQGFRYGRPQPVERWTKLLRGSRVT